jgi:hypothetical protein
MALASIIRITGAVTVFSPIDSTPITVYDPVSSAVNQAVANVDTNDPGLKQWYNAFEFNVNARLAHGLTLFGGTSTDRTISYSCPSAATNPNALLFCDGARNGIPWRTQFKLAGTYPLPKWGLVVGGSFQALPGYLLGTQPLAAGGFAPLTVLTTPNGAGTIYTVTQSTTYTTCPAALASCVPSQTRVIPGMTQASLNIPLIAPGTEMTPRLNQLDLSFSKRINLERWRIEPKVDLFNALNSSDYYSVKSLTYSTAATATYKLPASILQGRIVRLGVSVNF